MPSGVTHVLLSRHLRIGNNGPLQLLMDSRLRYFEFGSLGPDMPDGSILDDDILKMNTELKVKLHKHADNNHVPLLAFSKIKERQTRGVNRKELNALFAYFAGYMSHVVADGVMHPFITDKVGTYTKFKNKIAHSETELALDVLFFSHLYRGTGTEMELVTSEIEKRFRGFDRDLPYTKGAFEILSDCIAAVFGENVSARELAEWTEGIYRMFSLAVGRWPALIKKLSGNIPLPGYLDDIRKRKDQYLVLEGSKVPGTAGNFLNRDKVYMIKDCLPRYNMMMNRFLKRAYSYIYENGRPLTHDDIPPADLDTGRPPSSAGDFSKTPVYWQ